MGQKKGLTTIELLLAEELSTRSIPFETQYPAPPWLIDIALLDAQVAIEADGSYWHSLPHAVERDIRRDADLAARGWLVLRFSEADIRESPSNCIDKVMEHFSRLQAG